MARFGCVMLKSEKKGWYFAYPFTPGNFAAKRVLKLVERFSSHFFSFTTKLFTDRTIRGLLI